MKVEFNRVTWYSKLLTLALVIVLPFLGFWLGMKYQEALNPNTSANVTSTPTNNVATNSAKPTPGKIIKQTTKPSITVTYKDGIYYYSGTIQFPETCGIITAKTNVAHTEPAIITIFLTTQRPDGLCGQAFTLKPFSGQVSGPSGATVDVYLNDELVK